MTENAREVLPLCLSVAKKLQYPVYLVGGIVRDAVVLAGSSSATVHDFDYDIVCEGDARILAKEVAAQCSGAQLKTHDTFLTAKLTLSSNDHIDFVTARSEEYPVPGALPIVNPAPLSKDLYRRDFTVNAMAVTLDEFLHQSTPALIDPFDGKKALLIEKKLSVLHSKSFIDDPTRIFRASRYATRFSLTSDAQLEASLKECVEGGGLGTISNIRIVNELKRICDEPSPAASLLWLEQHGVLEKISFFNTSARNALGELTAKLPPEDFYKWAYQKQDKEARDGVFSQYGFGKKFFKMAQ